ncbi:MAG: hypothetical protein CVT48_01855 [Thermoplasmata archaeon HGW-Thermoplasmata-1]|nr:MAG: hypothetical protein CVT48_01855 [Thermoplasmata archaeon HGW-Thermoplasmata-1]
MKLSEEEAELFYKLNWSLLYYTNQKYPIIAGLASPNFEEQDPEKISALHEKFYSHPEIIDLFINENPFDFNEEEIGIIKSWKNRLAGNFFIMSHSKNHSIFLNSDEEQKAFGVVGLYDEIEDIIGSYVPVSVTTILLPFKGRIIYCGILRSSNIFFGAGIKQALNREYQKAKSMFGIITSLETPITKMEESDENLMKFYVKSEGNRGEYSDEIDQLLKKKPSLWNVYYQEIGRSNARKASKRFCEIGIRTGWYAIFEDVIIASGQSEKETRAQMDSILPPEKRDYAHVFKYVNKKK